MSTATPNVVCGRGEVDRLNAIVDARADQLENSVSLAGGPKPQLLSAGPKVYVCRILNVVGSSPWVAEANSRIDAVKEEMMAELRRLKSDIATARMAKAVLEVLTSRRIVFL